VLLLTLGNEAAVKVLKCMPSEQVEEVTAELIRMNTVTPETRAQVLDQAAAEIGQSMGTITGGGEAQAFRWLASIYGEAQARTLIERVHRLRKPMPFTELRRLEPGQLRDLLTNEHPQTIAIVLAHLDPRNAAHVLMELSPEMQVDVSRRIAITEQTTPGALTVIEQGLRTQAESIVSETRPVGGVRPLAQILNRVDRTSERQVLSGLQEADPGVAEQVKQLMFTFDDIVLLSLRDLQNVLMQCANDDLALALKLAPESISEKIYSALSKQRVEELREELSTLGQRRRRDVEEAQQKIVTIIRRMVENDEIVINRGGEGEDVLV
jgi:flagellar motor switch protein FliG